ncbi:hypothetical protein BH23BAC2_BH23BAC2_05700 [soil metagenome]
MESIVTPSEVEGSLVSRNDLVKNLFSTAPELTFGVMDRAPGATEGVPLQLVSPRAQSRGLLLIGVLFLKTRFLLRPN